MSETVIHCQVCDWRYVVPEINEKAADPRALASVFGYGVFAQHAMNDRARKTEEALEQHFATHKTVEWVRALTARDSLLREALAVLEQMPEPLIYKGNDDYCTKDLPGDYKYMMWHPTASTLLGRLRKAVG